MRVVKDLEKLVTTQEQRRAYDTYVRPTIEGDNRLYQLSEALSRIAPTVRKYYDEAAQAKYNKEVADDLRAWYVMKNKLTTGSISKNEYDEWRYKYPMLREDAGSKEGYYYNQNSGVQPPAMEVRDNTAIYSESDVVKILQFYKDQLMEKTNDK